jgi:4-hydroxy-4-methyl-2-oxoglutarate aldolase
MPKADAALIERLEKLPVAIVSDVLRYAGAPHQVLHHSIQSLGPMSGKSIAGPVFCVRGERLLGGVAPKNLRPEMFRRMPANSVIVMAAAGYEDAVVLGENIALSLQVRGCKAVVTDGGIRDRDSIAQMNMRVFTRFVSPLSSGQQWVTVELDAPVTVPGQAATVVEDAERVQEIENRTREGLLAGGDPEAVYAALPRFDGVRCI